MSNSYLSAAFGFTMLASEAELFVTALDAATELQHRPPGDTDRLPEAFASFGPEFAALFPPQPGDPAAGFAEIFDDPAFPYLSCGADFSEPDENGQVAAYFGSTEFSIGPIAELIFRICKSALPFGFEYATSHDKLRPGEFGGGYVLITESGVEQADTSNLLRRALNRAEADPEAGAADGYVLSLANEEDGLVFWNNDTGFGALQNATVFSETEAGAFDKPIAAAEPEWLALPRPLNV